MNARLKELRKALNLTQQEMADRLGIKRNTLANYEIGRNEPIDAVLLLIVKEFNVNENWLRTGEGEMFKPLSRSETIAKFAGELMKDEDDSFRRQLVEALAQLDEKEWEVLAGIAKKLTKKDQAEN